MTLTPEISADGAAAMTPPSDWSSLPEPYQTNEDSVKAQAIAIGEAVVAADVDQHGIPAFRAKAAADLNQKLVDTLTTVTTAGIDRARAGAQFVQTASTAIAGLYTGILGVLFVNDQAAPARAFIPMLFLGLAVVLATFYLAFVVPGKKLNSPKYEANADRDMWIRLNFVSLWVRRIVFPRAWALRTAVVSLFFGLLFLPVGIAKLPSDFDVPLLAVAPASTPAPVIWPEPTVLPDPSLSVVLYTAQLEEFRENLPPPASSARDTSSRDNFLATFAAAIALVLVAIVARDPKGWWRPNEEEGLVVGPDTIE